MVSKAKAVNQRLYQLSAKKKILIGNILELTLKRTLLNDPIGLKIKLLLAQ